MKKILIFDTIETIVDSLGSAFKFKVEIFGLRYDL
jgi:hypothetical protein